MFPCKAKQIQWSLLVPWERIETSSEIANFFVSVKECRTWLPDQQRWLRSQVNSVQHGDHRPDDQNLDHQLDCAAHVVQGPHSSSQERSSARKQVVLDCQYLEHLGIDPSESSKFWVRIWRIVSVQIKQSCPEHDHSVLVHRSSKSWLMFKTCNLRR